MQIQAFISSSGAKYFPTPGTRHGLTLVPLRMALVAVLASKRRARRTMAAVVVFGLLVVTTGSFGLT